MASSNTSFSNPGAASTQLAAFMAWTRRSFVAYARWLASITWGRFVLLSLLAMIAAGVLSELPPFNVRWGGDEVIYEAAKKHKSAPAVPATPVPPATPAAPTAPATPATPAKRPALMIDGKPYEFVIDHNGVRIGPMTVDKNGVRTPNVVIDENGVRVNTGNAAAAANAANAASTASAARSTSAGARAAAERVAALAQAEAASAAAQAEAARVTAAAAASAAAAEVDADAPGVTIKLPKNADTDEIRDAIQEAASAIEDAVNDAKPRRTVRKSFRLGDSLPQFMFLLIVLSGVTKLMAAGRFKAEAQAVVATEMAESEALKRQVVEARMAAMQAQVEPHFLFNTLASIDHLIETDPPRASRMQKNLIALLRAAMPSMREANAKGTRDLGRELAVIRPFLEILKVRMEERLQTEIRVSDGLLSAEFPPMMLQGLVENAIKHGLEPKADGGRLTVSAEIVHGKLAVTVADSGVGFGQAATAGTGIGLSNIRERLQLLYGGKAALKVADTPGGGTTVTITVPYLINTDRNAAPDTERPAGKPKETA